MQLPNKIFLLAALYIGTLGAGEWTLDGEDFAFDSTKGRARASGPVRFALGDWVIHASGEALVSSSGKIFKRQGDGDASRYGVEIDPAKIVFLGNCRLVNKDDGEILKAPFLILDLGGRTVTSSGSGLVVRVGDGFHSSGEEGAGVIVRLENGAVLLSGAGWSGK